MSQFSIAIGVFAAISALISAFVVGLEGGLLLFTVVGLEGIASELVLRREFFRTAYDRKSRELRSSATNPQFVWDQDPRKSVQDQRDNLRNEVIGLNRKIERYSTYLLFVVPWTVLLIAVFAVTQSPPWAFIGAAALLVLGWVFNQYVEVKLDDRRRQHDEAVRDTQRRAATRSDF